MARALGLPILTVDRLTPDSLVLAHRHDRLELYRHGSPRESVYADFLKGGPLHRRRFIGDHRQVLAKAIRIEQMPPFVVDATAGLCADAFRLAALGCRVVAIERSPVVAALIEDGLSRARCVPALRNIIDDRLRLVTADAREWLISPASPQRPDVVYLDPMFPPSRKASPAKRKEVSLLRAVVGNDPDAGDLFAVAQRVARRRVVVKRPTHASALAPNPTVTFRGSTVRYDVYSLSESATN